MKKYKWVQRAICFIIGHDVEWVIEHRLRYGHISLNRKGGKKRNQSRWVAGAYKICIILACIWLVTLLFFLYRLNLSV